MCENDMLLLDSGDYHCTKYNPYYRSRKLYLVLRCETELTDSTSAHQT
jgi:hypothetical protein